MSENLKRAESLFNRIMNPNGVASKEKTGYKPPNNGSGHHGRDFNKKDNYGGQNSRDSHHGGQTHGMSSNYNHHNGHSYSNHNSGKYNKYHRGGNHHGHHNSFTHNTNMKIVELQKNEATDLAQEILSKVSPEHHALLYCWTMWHHLRAKMKPKDTQLGESNSQPEVAAEELLHNVNVPVDSYMQTTTEIEFPAIEDATQKTKYIPSLEQLWLSLSSLKKTYELPFGTELLIFKSGITPVWEDPNNTKGGRWVFRFNRRLNMTGGRSFANVRERTSLIWERLLLRSVSGTFIPSGDYPEEVRQAVLSDISGLVLSVRKDDDIISIWNSNVNFGKKKNSDTSSKRISSFQARRVICDAILRVIREADAILAGANAITTLDAGKNERVLGVSFEYRLHSDNSMPSSDNKYRRYKLHYKPESEYVNNS